MAIRSLHALDIEHYLHEHIPLSKAMCVSVTSASRNGVSISAPFAPNINHEETVFGGSASAVAILSAWSLVYIRMKIAGVEGRIVIRANRMAYQKPMRGSFMASSTSPDEAAWSKLFSALERNRMGRIHVNATLTCMDEQTGVLEGEFVVLPLEGTAGQS